MNEWKIVEVPAILRIKTKGSTEQAFQDVRDKGFKIGKNYQTGDTYIDTDDINWPRTVHLDSVYVSKDV